MKINVNITFEYGYMHKNLNETIHDIMCIKIFDLFLQRVNICNLKFLALNFFCVTLTFFKIGIITLKLHLKL